MVRTALFSFFIILVFASCAFSDETRFLTSSTVRARALAMGGAYHSIEDDFSAGFYNPGAFKLNATNNERRFRIIFNPVAAGVSLYDYRQYNRDYEKDKKLTVEEALRAAALLFKGLMFTTAIADFGLGFGEEIIETEAPMKMSKRMYSAEGITCGSFHGAFLNLKIAPSVSLGITGTLYNKRVNTKDSYSGGYTFGVLLTPNPKMRVGIAYNKIPDDFLNARMGIESIENGTATSGISYHPDDQTVITMDLRAVNKEDQLTSREIHIGTERRFGERIALRAGYYRKKSTQNDMFSFGIGILPLWEKISKYSHSSRNDILSYTLIMEEIEFKRRWHVISLLLRF